MTYIHMTTTEEILNGIRLESKNNLKHREDIGRN